MYCSVCGNQLQANQQVCPQCGTAVPGTVPPVAPQQYPPPQLRMPSAMAVPLGGSRVGRHMHTLGILWLVYAGWSLVMWLFAATFFAGMFGAMGHSWGPFADGGPFGPGSPFARGFPFHLAWLLPFVTILVVARSLLGVFTGVALLRRERWGRTLSIVAAFLTLLKPITGTLLGIYTLWVLLPSESAREFDELTS